MNTNPLANIRVLVTRPRHQAQPVIARIRELGGKPFLLPTIEIVYNDYSPGLLAGADLIIFTSVNAVIGAQVDRLNRHTQGSYKTQIAAIGRATENALIEAGIEKVISPQENGNSESLLQLLKPGIVAGTRVVIVRGDSGRDTLREGLTELGAQVSYRQVYNRNLPNPATVSPTAAQLWQQYQPNIVSISSDLGLANLITLMPGNLHKQLFNTALVVNSGRCLKKARKAGFIANIGIANPPGDQGQIDQLIEFAGSLMR